MKLYRIARKGLNASPGDKTDKFGELFSSGGLDVKWTKEGKFWTRLAFVKLHIAQFFEEYCPKPYPYNSEDVIEEYILVKVKEITLKEFLGR